MRYELMVRPMQTVEQKPSAQQMLCMRYMGQVPVAGFGKVADIANEIEFYTNAQDPQSLYLPEERKVPEMLPQLSANASLGIPDEEAEIGFEVFLEEFKEDGAFQTGADTMLALSAETQKILSMHTAKQVLKHVL